MFSKPSSLGWKGNGCQDLLNRIINLISRKCLWVRTWGQEGAIYRAGGQSGMSGPNCKAGGHNPLAATPHPPWLFYNKLWEQWESRSLDSEAPPPLPRRRFLSSRLCSSHTPACLCCRSLRWDGKRGRVPASSLEVWSGAWTGTSCSFTILSKWSWLNLLRSRKEVSQASTSWGVTDSGSQLLKSITQLPAHTHLWEPGDTLVTSAQGTPCSIVLSAGTRWQPGGTFLDPAVLPKAFSLCCPQRQSAHVSGGLLSLRAPILSPLTQASSLIRALQF